MQEAGGKKQEAGGKKQEAGGESKACFHLPATQLVTLLSGQTPMPPPAVAAPSDNDNGCNVGYSWFYLFFSNCPTNQLSNYY